MSSRFTASIVGGSLGTTPKTVDLSTDRDVKIATTVAALFGATLTAKENQAQRTAANSKLLKGIRDMYSAAIYKNALAVANAEGDANKGKTLADVPAFMSQYFHTNVRSVETDAMKALAAEDMKPRPAATPATPGATGTPANPAPAGAATGSPPMAQPAK